MTFETAARSIEFCCCPHVRPNHIGKAPLWNRVGEKLHLQKYEASWPACTLELGTVSELEYILLNR